MSKCIVLVQHKPDKSHENTSRMRTIGSAELEDFFVVLQNEYLTKNINR